MKYQNIFYVAHSICLNNHYVTFLGRWLKKTRISSMRIGKSAFKHFWFLLHQSLTHSFLASNNILLQEVSLLLAHFKQMITMDLEWFLWQTCKLCISAAIFLTCSLDIMQDFQVDMHGMLVFFNVFLTHNSLCCVEIRGLYNSSMKFVEPFTYKIKNICKAPSA